MDTSIVKKASGSLNIAKLIVEMKEQGLVPSSYNLPYITFVPEGSISYIPELKNSTLQYLVEEKMNMLNSPSKVIQTDLKGLVSLYNEGVLVPGKGIKVMIGPDKKISMVQVLDSCELGKGYTLNMLRDSLKILDEYAFKDVNYKRIKVDILLKVKSLKGGE